MTSAKTAIRPNLSSAQASERVRGMVASPLRKKRLQVRILRVAQLRRPCLRRTPGLRGSSRNPPLRSSASAASTSSISPSAAAARLVRRDVKRIAQLVRDEHRRDPLEVAQLDDLGVDGQRRHRIEPGGRLVVEQQRRPRRHRPRDRDAAALAARQGRRQLVDVRLEADEAEHFFDALRALLRAACASLRRACSRRSRRP